MEMREYLGYRFGLRYNGHGCYSAIDDSMKYEVGDKAFRWKHSVVDVFPMNQSNPDYYVPGRYRVSSATSGAGWICDGLENALNMACGELVCNARPEVQKDKHWRYIHHIFGTPYGLTVEEAAEQSEVKFIRGLDQMAIWREGNKGRAKSYRLRTPLRIYGLSVLYEALEYGAAIIKGWEYVHPADAPKQDGSTDAPNRIWHGQ